jgi:8-oxo-dGTP pyrophosphatase MutT (NUDIX family)
MELIESTENAFGGVMTQAESLADDPGTFREQLKLSLNEWRRRGYRVAWLHLPIDKARLIPEAVEAGFTFHHADETGAMLVLRLEEDAFIPPYSTHYIGAGGAVFDGEGNLLVVAEKYRRRGRGRHYKLPGGALRPGEHIIRGVQREIKEETGIETEFEALVCFRHWHGYRYDKSDIYFVCRLAALNHDIRRQESEIVECFWVPVQEYLERDDVSAFNKRVVRAAVESPGIRPEEIEGYGTPETHELFFPWDSEERDL